MNQPSRIRGTYDPDQTRQALLAAATELFGQRGFAGASTGEIASRAGVNKAMINYHFGGKAGLYASILQEIFGEMTVELAALADSGLSPEKKLGRFIEAFGAKAKAHPQIIPMVLREMLTPDSPVREQFLPLILRFFGTLGAIIDEGVQQGVIRQVDPLLTHMALVGSLVFFFATEPTRLAFKAKNLVPFPLPDPGQFTEFIKDLYVRGLLTSPGRS